MYDADDTRELALYIEQASSGISDVRIVKLDDLRTMNGNICTEHWCITFQLDETGSKEVYVNGDLQKPKGGKAIFILPKAGEFNCTLGEIVHGDPDNAFVLVKHNYCMK